MSDPSEWQPGDRIINRVGAVAALHSRDRAATPPEWITVSDSRRWNGARLDDRKLARDWRVLDADALAVLFGEVAVPAAQPLGDLFVVFQRDEFNQWADSMKQELEANHMPAQVELWGHFVAPAAQPDTAATLRDAQRECDAWAIDYHNSHTPSTELERLAARTLTAVRNLIGHALSAPVDPAPPADANRARRERGRWVTSRKSHRCQPPKLHPGRRVSDLERKAEEGDIWECECRKRYRVQEDRDGNLSWGESGSFG